MNNVYFLREQLINNLTFSFHDKKFRDEKNTGGELLSVYFHFKGTETLVSRPQCFLIINKPFSETSLH